MAYIANTMFAIRANNNVFDELANITGVFNNSTPAAEICSAGFLCVRGDNLPNSAYSAQSITNANAYIMTAAASTANAATGVYACNTFNVNEVTDPVTGNIYKVGVNTLGLPLPAGVPGTFTKIDFASNDKIYRFGIGNLSAAISTNTFFTVANGLLVPAAAAPADNGAIYFKLVATGTAIQGTYAGMTYYDVMARSVVA
jgi:hypothetical protein